MIAFKVLNVGNSVVGVWKCVAIEAVTCKYFYL